jgi:signal transduction histidine kinase
VSYRTFKRLLGETSLERKCRWLMGTGTLLLMSVSFFIYAQQTEGLAYDQLTHTGRTLISPIIARTHVKQNQELLDGIDEFQTLSEKNWPDKLKGYTYRVILAETTRPTRKPDADDLAVLREFRENPQRNEVTRTLSSESAFIYNGAIRAGKSCVQCHREQEKLLAIMGDSPDARKTAAELANPTLEPGDLMGFVSVRLSTEMIESGFHQNRALLITFAIGSTLFILAGSYLVIRYVVVRPVQHLKRVSEAIAAGETNIRSEIHTGDEFEDLSIAYNRMLTNLIQVQQRNKSLIADLDHKVDQLAMANVELFQSNKLKADFLSTMSHELRTPLNHVIGFSENLLQAENLTEKQHRYAGNILTAGQLLLALINDVLDLAKMESGQMRARPTMVDLPHFCEQAVALFRPQAEKKNIELLVNLPSDPTPVRQDSGKLRQILTNLISNAIKFTPEGGRVMLTVECLPGKLKFTVSDTGVGIAPEEQDLVFLKFRQASNPLTREQAGTGLGLSIVRELAKLLGGDVEMQSELGRGSTFTVTVARNLPDDPMAAFETPVEPG